MRKKVITILTLCILCVTLCSCKSAEVKAAEEAITAIGEVSIESGDLIIAAEEAMAQIPEKDLTKVKNADALAVARATYDNMVAADEIDQTIEAAAADINLNSGAALENARNMIAAASEEVLAFVKNGEMLAKAEKVYSDARVKNVTELINQIGIISDDSQPAIDAAEEALLDLTEEERSAVKNAQKVADAKDAMITFRANVVIQMIQALEPITVSSGDAITAAQAAYDELSEEAKERVTNADVLQAAPEALKAAAREVGEKLMAAMKKTVDEGSKCTLYYPVTWQWNDSHWSVTKGSFVRPYISVSESGEEVSLRVVYNHNAADWVFWTDVTVTADGETFTDTFDYYSVVRGEEGKTVWEYMDTPAETKHIDMLRKMAAAKEVKVTFAGRQYTAEFTVSDEEKKGIKDALDVYDALNIK